MQVDFHELGNREAYIVENVEPRFPRRRWHARWHHDTEVEDMPYADTFADTVAWAAARAPKVRLSLEEALPDPDLDDPWLAADVAPLLDAARLPGFGGTVIIAEARPWLIASETFTVYRRIDRDDPPARFTDVDDAIDWARDGADSVVVGLFADRDRFDHFRAGSSDRHASLPRLRAADNAPMAWRTTASAASGTLSADELQAIVDTELADTDARGLEVTDVQRIDAFSRAAISLTLRISCARYTDAARLAERFQLAVAASVARHEQPEADRHVFMTVRHGPRWVEPLDD